MNRLNNTDLAKALALTHGLTLEEAELFLAFFVESIHEGLEEDKIVKIKGFGIFKVSEVSARESIDVNTGERIVIPRREKISFTADSSMRELVNSPFEQFETVILNEDADFSNIDSNIMDDNGGDIIQEDNTEYKSSPILKETLNICPEIVDEEDVVKSDNPADLSTGTEHPNEEETQSANVNEKNSELVEPLISSLVMKNDEVTEHHDENVPMSNAELVENPETMENRTSDHSLADEWAMKRLAAENENLTRVNTDLRHSITIKNRIIAFLAICVLLLLAGCAFGVFEMYRLVGRYDKTLKFMLDTTSLDTLVISEVDTCEKTLPSAKTELKNPVSAIQEKKETTASKAVMPKPQPNQNASKQKNEATTTTSVSSPTKAMSYYNNDYRIRTGAYNIVGVAQTITVKSGQTLHSLSRSYLGEGMECYMEAVNGGKRELKVGEKIKIPKLELKKKRK